MGTAIPDHVSLAGELAAALSDLEMRARDATLRPLTAVIAREARKLHDRWRVARELSRLPPDLHLTDRLEAAEQALDAHARGRGVPVDPLSMPRVRRP